MIGREGWEEFAAANGLTWEKGPPNPRDQYGSTYETFLWDGDPDRLLKHLTCGGRLRPKHIVIRMFPHYAELPEDKRRSNLMRIRFSSYLINPAAAVARPE